MRTCEDGSMCLQEAARIAVSAAIEEMAGCLAEACTPKPNQTTSTTTSSIAPAPSPSPSPGPAPSASPGNLSRACPGVVVQCKNDAMCKGAWLCMEDHMQTCEDGSVCLQEAVGRAAPTAQLEEMAGCLGEVCSSPAPATTTSTAAPRPSPAPCPSSTPVDVRMQDLQKQCPEAVRECHNDIVCRPAWSCMEASMHDCGTAAKCVQDASQGGPSVATQGMTTCLACLGCAALPPLEMRQIQI